MPLRLLLGPFLCCALTLAALPCAAQESQAPQAPPTPQASQTIRQSKDLEQNGPEQKRLEPAAKNADQNTRFAELRAEALAGDADAQFQLSQALSDPKSPHFSIPETALWLERAAKQGHPLAQFNLARLYDTGTGLLQSDEKAMAWYRKSAEQGVADAQMNLALMLEMTDIEEAERWLRRLADIKDVQAQFRLGMLLTDPDTISQQRFDEGVALLHQASNGGWPPASTLLAIMLANGERMERDEAQAMRLLHKAAREQEPAAAHNLALAYWEGRGVERNPALAYLLALIAADQLESSQALPDVMGAEMSDQEWVETQDFLSLCAERDTLADCF